MTKRIRAIALVSKIISRIISFVIIITAIVFFGAVYFNSVPRGLPDGLDDNSLIFEVRNGESASSVG